MPGYDDYLAGRWGGPTDADFNWTSTAEERAAGWPGAMPGDYQDPELTETLDEEASA